MRYEVVWVDTDEAITRVCAALDRAAARGEVAGLDTEFYGVDLRSKSCVAESKLHLLSVAVKRHPTQLAPRGYSVADAAVLGRRCLDHGRFRAWLESEAPKAVHNLPVDAHTLGNEGITLGGGINTLAMARWAWPHRARAEGFTLDALGRDYCGTGKTEGFDDIFTEHVPVEVVREKRERACECGEIPRRGHPRGRTAGHGRLERVVLVRSTKIEERQIPLESVGPGHVLWERTLRYAAQDAVLALAVHELAQETMRRRQYDVPWLA